MPSSSPVTTTIRASLTDLVRYFLYLGTFGFGGPVALIGFMHRDLVERRRWRVRPPGGDDLPGAASSRASGLACRSLGHGRFREAAA